MELTGTKCTLRPWRTDDADALVRHANNRKIWRNMCERFPHPYTAEKANEWLGEPIHSAVPHTSFAISIDGEAVGGTGFSILDDVHRTTARAGYWIAEPLWGRGIVTGAFLLLCDYIFAAFADVHRIEATVFEWNPASCRVLEKCGFTQEGRMRKACIKDGQVIDVFLYVLTR